VRFDYGWMKKLDRIKVSAVAAPGPLRYVRLDIDGPESPYRFVFGNLDLAQLNESKYFEMSFGLDPMPRNGRHWADFDPCLYRLEGKPETVKPFLFMVNSADGTWANNQKLGLDKLYIGWESPERKVLWVYLVTYERVISVWMGRVKITDPALNADRIRNAVFRPELASNYPAPDFAATRKFREAGNAQVTQYGPAADTTTLDFESLRHEDDRLAAHGFIWQEKGFQLTAAAFLGGEPFRSLGTRAYGFSGSTALINGNREGINILRKKDETVAESLDEQSGYFDLISMDLSGFGTGPQAPVDFIGVKRDSGTVVQTCRSGGKAGPRPCRFEGFEDLVAVRWISHGMQFDNIRIRYPGKRRSPVLSWVP